MTLHEAVSNFKRQYIVEALARNKGNQCAAARELGAHRNTISRNIETLNIRPKKKPAAIPAPTNRLEEKQEEMRTRHTAGRARKRKAKALAPKPLSPFKDGTCPACEGACKVTSLGFVVMHLDPRKAGAATCNGTGMKVPEKFQSMSQSEAQEFRERLG